MPKIRDLILVAVPSTSSDILGLKINDHLIVTVLLFVKLG